MKILVTGAAGFIGSALMRDLDKAEKIIGAIIVIIDINYVFNISNGFFLIVSRCISIIFF